MYVYIVQQEDSIKFGEKMAAETVKHRQMFANKFSFPQEGHIKLDFLPFCKLMLVILEECGGFVTCRCIAIQRHSPTAFL